MSVTRISSDKFVYVMDKKNPAVLTVRPGARLVFETKDAYDGQIESEDQDVKGVDLDTVCPSTGPVAVEGAVPGDAIKVYIEKIENAGPGIIVSLPGLGIFAEDIKRSTIIMADVKKDGITFANGIKLPWRPMIGVLGTAPKDEPIPCGFQDNHGGNMDCMRITEGCTVYLPVFHPGGMLSIGDVHGCQGDGEINGTAVEMSANVHVTVDLVKGMNITDPMLETDDMLYSLVSDETMEKATKRASKNIRDLTSKKINLDDELTNMLCSLVGSLEICQIVDPKVTVRFGMPKWVLDKGSK